MDQTLSVLLPPAALLKYSSVPTSNNSSKEKQFKQLPRMDVHELIVNSGADPK